MTRSQKFFNGVVLNYSYQAVVMITGLWLTPFLLARIGQHDYGLWLVGSQLLLYLTLTDFGLVALLPLETAYATGRAGGVSNLKEVPEIVGRTARLVLYQLPVVIAVAGAMWLTIPPAWQSLRIPLGIVLLGFVLAFPLRMLPALLQGLQDLSFLGLFQILNWALTTFITIWMVIDGCSLLALAVGWLISQTAMAPVYAYRIWTKFPEAVPRRLPSLSGPATKMQLTKGFWNSVAQVAQLLMSNCDLLILGKLLGPAAVVPYVCTQKLGMVLANQAQLLMQTATPGLCELKTGESRERLFQALIALCHGIMTASGLIFCVVLMINHWFVDWWVTAHQYGGFLLTVMILAATVVRHWTMMTAYSVFCFGYQRRISLTNLCDGLISAGSCVAIVSAFGPVGAPIATMLGACLVSLPLNLSIMAREVGATVTELVTAMLKDWFWRFSLIAIAVIWVAYRWSPKNPLEAALAAASAAIAYAAVLTPTILRSPLRTYVLRLLATYWSKYNALAMRFSS